MEKMNSFYKNKKILVTGATGFKGSWLCCWLLQMGAKVYGTGYSPNQNKNLFYKLKLQKKIKLGIFDIRDKKKLDKFISKYKPTIIFHLAAQPLIIESYLKPHKTIDVNVGGTLNVLEASKNFKFIKSLVMITSDKCYENVGKLTRYKENDVLGGIDPYSASKSSSELIIRAYRESFFKDKRNCGVSSARAGNVIGGGDWSANRLIPDGIRSLLRGKSIYLRNPKFNRPWQHVLEPLRGYIDLSIDLYKSSKNSGENFNFGPRSKENYKVIEIIKMIQTRIPNLEVKIDKLQKSVTRLEKKLSDHIEFIDRVYEPLRNPISKIKNFVGE